MPAGLDEAELEERLYGPPAGPQRSGWRAALDFAGMRKELAAAVAGGPVAAWRWVRLLAGMQDCTIAGVKKRHTVEPVGGSGSWPGCERGGWRIRAS